MIRRLSRRQYRRLIHPRKQMRTCKQITIYGFRSDPEASIARLKRCHDWKFIDSAFIVMFLWSVTVLEGHRKMEKVRWH